MLFKEPVEMPDKETMTAVMEQHIGSTECFCYDKKMAGFAALDHIAEFKDGTPNLNMIKSHSDHATTVLLHLVKKGSLTTCKTTDSVGAHGNIGNKSIKK